jgi:uncharacterized membrane protein YfcA
MFPIYLPIAELPVDLVILLMVGAAGGFLAGMFGVGGGFIITPILIFLGIPPSVAVATSSNQIIASSISGCLAHFKKGNVDIKMGAFLLIGGLVGGAVGLWIFAILRKIGQIDLAISLSYVIFLGTTGGIMAYESSRYILREKGWLKERKKIKKKMRILGFLYGRQILPFKMHFPNSGITVSAVLPILIGAVAGLMVSIMGIGGGFLMIPAMIYLLRMSTGKAVGTSLFQIIFTTSIITFMHALTSQTVDAILAVILITGGVIGAQFGHAAGEAFPAHKLRWMLSIIILAVCASLAYNLVATPKNLYSVSILD